MEISSPDADRRPLSIPAEITAHTGVTEDAGNAWDIAQSPDRTLDLES